MVTMGLTSSLQVTASFGTLDDEKENGGQSSSHRRLTRFFCRLKHYLRMLVCQHGVYMEIKMAESN